MRKLVQSGSWAHSQEATERDLNLGLFDATVYPTMLPANQNSSLLRKDPGLVSHRWSWHISGSREAGSPEDLLSFSL